MKLLIFHPQMGPGDPLVRSLQTTGAVILVANTPEQAKQLLVAHALTLEVAVIHREPNGLELIPFIKSNPSLLDLPYVITSSEWTDADFGKHQESAEGANAYLREEFCGRDLRFVLEQVLGCELSMALVAPAPVTESGVSGLSLSRPEVPVPDTSGQKSEISIKFEDATKVFGSSSSGKGSKSFSLDVDPIRQLSSDDVATDPSAATQFLQSPGADQAAKPATSVSIQPDDGATRMISRGASGAEAATQAPAGQARSEVSGVVVKPLTGSLEIAADSSSQPAAVAQPVKAEKSTPDVSLQLSHEGSAGSTVATGSSVTGEKTFSETTSELAAELPYLFGQAARPRPGPPVSDAVVPGGAAHSPDIETLKRYLALREQDVAALSAQIHEARHQIRKLEEDLRQSHALMEEQGYQLEGKERREQEFEREKALLTQGLQAEIEELRFQMKARADKGRVLESQVRDAGQEMERLRERVRNDIRKIRVREKELENRIEIIKKDSEALLMTREATILELKRKLDTAEFNLDLMHDRLGRERDLSAELREKLMRASQAVRLAGGLLDPADPDAAVADNSGRPAGRTDRKVS